MNNSKTQNMGTGGYCICVKCGFTIGHQPGSPCQEERCPLCNRKLLRKDSLHYQMYIKKQNSNNK